ncbi:hypothetical protein L2E82_37642 [Cichorium intybus]|uniref:Uncharacterized protein n=1 Tax=Cichorium intybus TaxID=13427 RepID=A0ACB9AE33_CICIN|nr:hypothetical protein L2E82_37642 [Cichorium intybus]
MEMWWSKVKKETRTDTLIWRVELNRKDCFPRKRKHRGLLFGAESLPILLGQRIHTDFRSSFVNQSIRATI